MARAAPLTAAGYVDRIPPEYRAAWIAQVATPYGLSDPSGALAWVAQFQGQAGYDDAARGVITGMAQADARSAAQALAQSSADVQLGAAPVVAAALAREDPRAAARFAENLADERAQRGAIGAAVSAWAATDLAGARNYTLGLDRGEVRDQALSALLLQTAQSGSFDRSLLDAFSADAATQETLGRAIPLISRRDPEAARELLGRVTSAESRRRIEEQIEQLNALQ
jgi:hypothetical protein